MRILACSTDAGGAKNIREVLNAFDNNKKNLILSSKSTYPIFNELGFSFKNINVDNINYPFLKEIFKTYKPDCVLAGATRFYSIDRQVVQLAKKLQIFSIVIFDEWYYYKNRFLDDKGDMNCLPDVICCQDQLAYQEAIDEGIPQKLLKITGSPALSALWKKRKEFEKKPPKVPDVFEKTQKPIILFLSETHASDFGVNEDGGPLGAFLGYTEDSVAQDLYKTMRDINRKCIIIEKFHPAVDLTKNHGIITQNHKKINWIKVSKIPLSELIWYSDVVIGMRSIALLEAALLGKPTISYQPGLSDIHRQCTAERLGLTERIETIEDLKNWLFKFGFDESTSKEEFKCITMPEFAPFKAVNNIIEIISESVKKD